MGVAYLDKVLDGSSHGSDWPRQVLNDLPLLCFFMEDNQLGHLRLKGRTEVFFYNDVQFLVKVVTDNLNVC